MSFLPRWPWREQRSSRFVEAEGVELAILAAELEEARGRWVEADVAAQRAVELAPRSLVALRVLGRTRARIGDTASSVRVWQRAVALGGGVDLADQTELGIALSLDGRHEEALAILDRIADHSAGSGAALANLGRALMAAGRGLEAVSVLRRAVLVEPASAQARLNLGVALADQRLWPAAIEQLELATRLAPSWDVAFYNLGLASSASGQVEAARVALERAAQLAPGDQEVARALAELPPPAGLREEGRDTIAGDLDSFALLDLLEFLRLQNKSGALVLTSAVGAGVIRMAAGRVTSATSPATPRLGRLLLERGLVAPLELERALCSQALTAGLTEEPAAIGAVLLRRGLVSREGLREVLLEQCLGALAELSAWRDGTFSFLLERSPSEPPTIDFDLHLLSLEMLRRQDESDLTSTPPPARR